MARYLFNSTYTRVDLYASIYGNISYWYVLVTFKVIVFLDYAKYIFEYKFSKLKLFYRTKLSLSHSFFAKLRVLDCQFQVSLRPLSHKQFWHTTNKRHFAKKNYILAKDRFYQMEKFGYFWHNLSGSCSKC